MSERNDIHENFRHTKHSVLTAPDEHMPSDAVSRERERERDRQTDRQREKDR